MLYEFITTYRDAIITTITETFVSVTELAIEQNAPITTDDSKP